jgi:hypothetical protein
MNAFALTDQAPVVTLLGRAMQQSEIPGQGHGNRSPFDQVNPQGILERREVPRPGHSTFSPPHSLLDLRQVFHNTTRSQSASNTARALWYNVRDECTVLFLR